MARYHATSNDWPAIIKSINTRDHQSVDNNNTSNNVRVRLHMAGVSQKSWHFRRCSTSELAEYAPKGRSVFFLRMWHHVLGLWCSDVDAGYWVKSKESKSWHMSRRPQHSFAASIQPITRAQLVKM